jgi:glycosyltransferase involved in cell wall biosynthesis
VSLSIYGPAEDLEYWLLCQRQIELMPVNINIKYYGEVEHKIVPLVLSKADVFILPTLGENFGHVIFEALSVGTPVIISDNTPWVNDELGAIEVLSLLQPEKWVEAINRRALFDDLGHAQRRKAALDYSRMYVAKNSAIEKNFGMLAAVMAKTKASSSV